jgi:hypothetical protein
MEISTLTDRWFLMEEVCGEVEMDGGKKRKPKYIVLLMLMFSELYRKVTGALSRDELFPLRFRLFQLR